MNKLLITLAASLFAVAAFAQPAPGPGGAGGPGGPGGRAPMDCSKVDADKKASCEQRQAIREKCKDAADPRACMEAAMPKGDAPKKPQP